MNNSTSNTKKASTNKTAITPDFAKVISAQDSKITNLTSRITKTQEKLASFKKKLEGLLDKKIIILFPSFKTLLKDVIEIIDILDGKSN